MVCPRCITSVKEVLESEGVIINSIGLGEVEVKDEIEHKSLRAIKEKLQSLGFELLEDQKSKTIDAIKSIIIDQIHYTKESLVVNLSILLSEKLNQEYTSLSKLFSSIEGITIERFVMKQKIEKVKELIFYKELTLSEIAYQLGYSSVAHLSSQFKKETSITPTEFKKLKTTSRKSLDNV